MPAQDAPGKGRIIGIGGVFLKSGDHKALASWYRETLGLPTGEDGEVILKWRSFENPDEEHYSVWSASPNSSTYFGPSKAPFMINYVVDDLDPKREDSEFGRFAWVYDPDGNKLELWQPA